MGTSLLSIPWALQQAGFACGMAMVVGMTGICFYTAYRIVRTGADFNAKVNTGSEQAEFTDICRYYLGRPGYYVALVFSLLALMGAMIVYWVLLTNFLFNSVDFVYSAIRNSSSIVPLDSNGTFQDGERSLNLELAVGLELTGQLEVVTRFSIFSSVHEHPRAARHHQRLAALHHGDTAD